MNLLSEIQCPLSEMASLLLMSPRRVQQLAQEGVLTKEAQKNIRGVYPLVPNIQGYIRYLQERSIRTDTTPIDYHAEKARLTKMQADLAEVEAAKAKEEVVEIATVQRQVSHLFQEVQTNLRLIPSRVASTLCGISEERVLKETLLQAIDEVLTCLADATIGASEAEAPEGGEDG